MVCLLDSRIEIEVRISAIRTGDQQFAYQRARRAWTARDSCIGCTQAGISLFRDTRACGRSAFISTARCKNYNAARALGASATLAPIGSVAVRGEEQTLCKASTSTSSRA
jgi:hypothetical protein